MVLASNLAKVEGALASTPDGRSILRGTVTLDYPGSAKTQGAFALTGISSALLCP